jgi:hypothetical protein
MPDKVVGSLSFRRSSQELGVGSRESSEDNE